MAPKRRSVLAGETDVGMLFFMRALYHGFAGYKRDSLGTVNNTDLCYN